MAGIPSIGDILMLSQTAWKVGRAFTAGRKGAPAEFRSVESELRGLTTALNMLGESLFADDSILGQADEGTKSGVATILLSCQQTLKDLDSLVDQYRVIRKTPTAGGYTVERSWSEMVIANYRTMMWTTEGGNIQELRNILAMHTQTINITMQALQSKSLTRLERTIHPMAEKVDVIHNKIAGDLSDRIEEVLKIVTALANSTPTLQPRPDRTSSLLALSEAEDTSPRISAVPPPRNPLRNSLPTPDQTPELLGSEPATSQLFQQRRPNGQNSLSPRPVSPRESWDVYGSTVLNPQPERANLPRRDTDTGVEYRQRHDSVTYPVDHRGRRNTENQLDLFLSEMAITERSELEAEETSTPPVPQPGLEVAAPNGNDTSVQNRASFAASSVYSQHLSQQLPPPAMDPEVVDPHNRVANTPHLSLMPTVSEPPSMLTRSQTTASQKTSFEKAMFKNSATFCDVHADLVEYTQHVDEENPFEMKLVEAATKARICLVRRRDTLPTGHTRLTTSIWALSDDGNVRLQQKLPDGESIIPYSSFFTPTKISITIVTELRYHDITYGAKPLTTAKTSWVNYLFDDVTAANLFQSALIDRKLLASFRTEKTIRIQDGLSGMVAYQQQLCAMENLRCWEDESSGVLLLVHYSYTRGYLAFYLNSSAVPVRVKDDGGKMVKIKGLNIPLEKEGYGVGGSVKVPETGATTMVRSISSGGELGRTKSRGGKSPAPDKKKEKKEEKKMITGVKIEFASEDEKSDFLALVRRVQEKMIPLPELVG